MMCEKCGKPTEQDATLCPDCIAAQNAAAKEGVAPAKEEPIIELATGVESPKPNKKIFIGLAAAVLAVIAIVVAIFAFGGEDVKTFDTPQEQLVYVEGEALGEYAEGLSNVYGEFINNVGTGDNTASVELHVQMGEDLLALAENFLAARGAQMELDWLTDIGLSLDVTNQEDLAAYALALKLGDNHILAFDAIADMANSKVYMTIPELNPTYLFADMSAEMEEEELEAYSQNREAITSLAKSLPSEQDFSKMLISYIDLVLSRLPAVEKTTETVTVGGISQEQTVLVVKLSQEDLVSIVIALAEKAKDDATVKQFVSSIQDYVNEVGASSGIPVESIDVQAEFGKAMDSLIDELKVSLEDTDPQNYIQLKTYVDGKNNVMGRSLTVHSAEEEPTEVFNLQSAQKNDTTATLLQVSTVALSGEKTEKKESTSATYTLSVGGDTVVTLSCTDMTDNSGSVRIVPSEAFVEDVLEGMDVNFTVPGEVALILDYNTADDKSDISLRAELDQKALVALLLKGSTSNKEAIQIPENAVDPSSLAVLDWLKNLDISTVKTNLTTAGAPAEIVELLDTLASSLLNQLV